MRLEAGRSWRTRAYLLLGLFAAACATSVPPGAAGTQGPEQQPTGALPSPKLAPPVAGREPAPEVPVPDPPPPELVARLPGSIACKQTAPLGNGPAPGHKGPIGSLDKEDIRTVVRIHLPSVKFCHDRNVGSGPYPQGKLSVRFSVAPSGKVPLTCLESSELKNPAIERCLLDDILLWQFPKPNGGGYVTVSYPFVFLP